MAVESNQFDGSDRICFVCSSQQTESVIVDEHCSILEVATTGYKLASFEGCIAGNMNKKAFRSFLIEDSFAPLIVMLQV